MPELVPDPCQLAWQVNKFCKRRATCAAKICFNWQVRRLLALTVVLLPVLSTSGAENVRIDREEPWSCYFGGRKVTLHYRIATPTAIDRRASWSFAVREQVVARREAAVRATPGTSGRLEIVLELPEPRPGTIIPATVTVAVGSATRLEHPLWIFPEDPFEGRRAAMEEMNLVLFDPEKKTARLLEQYRVPFKLVRDMAGLAAIERGLVVIGEGASFREWRTLPETMVRTASRGLPVVCLAAAAGEMPVPGIGEGRRPRPTTVFLRQSDAITALDKRLDTLWPPDGKAIASRIELKGSRLGVTGEVTAGDDGWPWVESVFAERGRLLVCGFAIVAKWESGPAPRYLLANVLSYASGRTSGMRHDGTGNTSDMLRGSLSP